MDAHDEIRRKLLKATVYAPPVILGSMVATPRTVMGAIGQLKQCTTVAGAVVSIVISSGTNACCPCIPTAVKYDPVKCVDKQCIKSCGALCTPAQLAATKCKDFCKNCGVVVVGCRQPCQCSFDPNKAKYVCK